MRKILCGLVVFLCTLTLWGQSSTSLTGAVTDPSGAVIPGATVEIRNESNGASRQSVSDSSGRYSFQQVAPGTYTIVASASGFNTETIPNVRLLVSTPATVEIKFNKVGTVAEVVAVSADAVQVNTTDASLGNAIGTTPITQLPFEARNVVGLLALQPGVVYIGEPDPGATNDYRSGAVNGGKSDQANVTLDGVDVNDQQGRQAFKSVLRVTLDSTQEFRTVTTNAGAEFGRTSGAQVTLVTKSGTNTVHGSLYEYLRNTATSANTFFNNENGVPRQKLNRNVFGASVGGPIKKNRIFYFLNYEGRRDASQAGGLRVVPNDTFRQGIFTYIRKDNSVGQLTPDQIKAIDPAHIGVDPAVLQLFQSYPHPNDTTVGDGLNTAGFRFNAATPLRWSTYIAKFDWQVDAAGKHQIFWRGNLQNDNTVPSSGIAQFPGDSPASVFLENSKGYAIGYIALLRPNLVSNFHFGFTRQGTQSTGLETSGVAYFRNIDPRNAITKGLTQIIPVYQAEEDLAWTKGAHNVNAGFVARVIRNNRLNYGSSFSDVYGNSSWLLGSGGNLLASDAKSSTAYRRQFSNILGLLPEYDAQYNYDIAGNVLPEGTGIQRNFASEEYEGYLQDSWKVRRNLTVTYGVRLSFFVPVSEQNGYQTSSVQSLEDFYNQRGALAASGQPQSLVPRVTYVLANKGGRDLYPFQKDVAPRFSFAYSPDASDGWMKRIFGGPGRSSIRGGFGMYYDLFGQGLIRSADSTSLGFSTLLQNPANQSAATIFRYTGFTNLPFAQFPPAPPGGFPQEQPDIFQITNGVDDKLKAPYTMNLDFSVQRDLGGGFVLQGAYVGRLSRRSLIRDDLAMPTNLKDTKSGMTYFDAARQLTGLINQGVPISQVPKIPFFENLWPGAATSTLTATQSIYDEYRAQGGDYTTGLYNLDVPGGDLCCSILGPYSMFNSQYSTLSAFRSRGGGSYHAMQWTVRKRFSAGYQFDFNYTWSKSEDLGSTRENAGNYAGTIVNSWFPGLNKAVSDYDTTHIFSAFWVAEVPVGKGKRFMDTDNRFFNAALGGWALNGVFRATSGFPVGVIAGGVWPTNWETGSYAIQTGAVPGGNNTTKNAAPPTSSGSPGPNIFSNPATILASYSLPLAGDVGQRNGIRGDGVFSLDLGLGKRFHLFNFHDQPHTLQFRAEVFNVSNTVRFDPQAISLDILNPNRFGQYTDTLSKPRVFQFSARYEF